MLIIGSYQYLMAAGNIGKIDSAKETISSALFGLILGLTAYIILYKINPDLVNMRAITQISGGALTTRGIVDSSTVTGFVSRLYNKKVQTFTIGYKDRTFSELPYARIVSDYFDTEPNILMMVEL